MFALSAKQVRARRKFLTQFHQLRQTALDARGHVEEKLDERQSAASRGTLIAQLQETEGRVPDVPVSVTLEVNVGRTSRQVGRGGRR